MKRGRRAHLTRWVVNRLLVVGLAGVLLDWLLRRKADAFYERLRQ